MSSYIAKLMYLEKSKWVIIWDGGSTFLKNDLQKGNKQEITNFATSLMPPFSPSVSSCFWTNYLCSIFLSFNHPWTCSSLPCSLLDRNSTIHAFRPFTLEQLSFTRSSSVLTSDRNILTHNRMCSLRWNILIPLQILVC